MIHRNSVDVHFRLKTMDYCQYQLNSAYTLQFQASHPVVFLENDHRKGHRISRSRHSGGHYSRDDYFPDDYSRYID